MKTKRAIMGVAFAATLLLNGNAFASLANPIPFLFQEDTGTEVFTHTATKLMFSLELKDVGGKEGSSEFGFFFGNTDPREAGNRITIFGEEDKGFPQLATVNFETGRVFDLDDFKVQSTFSGSGAIGFYYKYSLPASDSVVAESILYSVARYNEGGKDYAGTFPLKGSTQAFMIAFASPTDEILSLNFTSGLGLGSEGNMPPVPLPPGIILFGSGLLGMMPALRRKRK